MDDILDATKVQLFGAQKETGYNMLPSRIVPLLQLLVLGVLETLIFLHDSFDLSFLANGLTPEFLTFEWCAFLNAVATTAILLLNWHSAKQHQRALRSGFLACVLLEGRFAQLIVVLCCKGSFGQPGRCVGIQWV
jgi:hypothetical protein